MNINTKDEKGHYIKDKTLWETLLKKHKTIRRVAQITGHSYQSLKNLYSMLGIHSKHTPLANLSNDEFIAILGAAGGVRAAAKILRCSHTGIVDQLVARNLSWADILVRYQEQIVPNWEIVKAYGDIAITADYHVPFTNLLWVRRLLKVCKEENIKQLIIGGDFFDFDRLSYWIKRSQAEDITVSLEEEFAFAEMLLEGMETQFERIYFLGGNHWLRLLSAVHYSISSERLLGLVGRKDDPRYIFTGLFDWMLLDDKLRISHPRKGRKLDYTLARDISVIHPDQWVVITHRHRNLEGHAPDGRPMFEIGWMGDATKLRYLYLTDTTYYKAQNGFAIYKNGRIRLYTDYNYNWEEDNEAHERSSENL